MIGIQSSLLENVGDLTDDDIIMKASLYGIHHPVTYHSFCNSAYLTAPSLLVASLSSSFFVPSSCLACQQTVFPFINSCICLRCRSVAHRACLRKVTTKCSAALFQGLEATGNLQSADISMVSLERDLESVISKVCLIPKVLKYIPEPASEFCIWQTIVRAVMQRFPVINRRKTHPFKLRDAEKTVAAVTQLLDDSSSLPGQLVRVLHGSFVGIDFALSDEDALRHARECLDTLAFSLLSYLHLGDECTNSDEASLRETICHTCDNHLLSLNFGIMYNKIFRCTLRRVDSQVRKIRNNIPPLTTTTTTVTTSADSSITETAANCSNTIISKINNNTTTSSGSSNSIVGIDISGSGSNNTDDCNNSPAPTIISRARSSVCICEDVLSTVNELSIALADSKLVIDKLDILVKILQILSAPVPTTSINYTTVDGSDNNSNVSNNKEEDDDNVHINKYKKDDIHSSTDTDELLESLCSVIQCSMAANDYCNESDDMTFSRSASMIRKSDKKYTSNIHWLAEFAYMSCSVLLRDLDSVSIGPLGYALVTLQQCMHILYGIDSFAIDVSRR